MGRVSAKNKKREKRQASALSTELWERGCGCCAAEEAAGLAGDELPDVEPIPQNPDKNRSERGPAILSGRGCFMSTDDSFTTPRDDVSEIVEVSLADELATCATHADSLLVNSHYIDEERFHTVLSKALDEESVLHHHLFIVFFIGGTSLTLVGVGLIFSSVKTWFDGSMVVDVSVKLPYLGGAVLGVGLPWMLLFVRPNRAQHVFRAGVVAASCSAALLLATVVDLGRASYQLDKNECQQKFDTPWCRWSIVTQTTLAIVFMGCLVASVRALRLDHPRRVLVALHRVVAAGWLTLGIFFWITSNLVVFLRPSNVHIDVAYYGCIMSVVLILVGLASLRLDVTHRLQRQVAHCCMSKKGGPMTLAVLMTMPSSDMHHMGTELSTLIDHFKTGFRYVDAGRVTEESLGEHIHGEYCYAMSQPADLVSKKVDAVVLHCHRDGPRERWEALRKWRLSFLSQHGREPRVWIDKFCLEPGVTHDSPGTMASSPMRLAVCDRAVVLCGPELLKELPFFIHLYILEALGKVVDSLDIIPIVTSHEAFRAMHRAIEELSLNECTFKHTETTEDILTALESSLGNLELIEDTAHSMLCSEVVRAQLTRQWSEVVSGSRDSDFV